MLSKAEEGVLSAIGYMVIRWNYAEKFARGIVGKYVRRDSIFHPEYLALLKKQSMSIEQGLRDIALPQWTGEGRPYLECLIAAYARARSHRNHLVHGVYDTFWAPAMDDGQAFLHPAMPRDGKPQAPSFIKFAEIRATANHFHDLALFCRDVDVAFDAKGGRAVDGDGRAVVAQLPPMLAALPECVYETIDPGMLGIVDGA